MTRIKTPLEWNVRYLRRMQVRSDQPAGVYRLRAYSDTQLIINDTSYATSVIVSPDAVVELPDLRSPNALRAAHLQRVLAMKPEVVLLGTGRIQVFPSPDLGRTVLAAGIGLETMDSRAACRTYNVLLAESRRVAALIILENENALDGTSQGA